MDIVTQGLAAGVLAQTATTRAALRWAALAGFCAGLLPDLDFFIASDDDPLLRLEYHRHFSHALLFAPVGGLLTAVLLWPLTPLRRALRFRRLVLYTTLGWLSSALLDACTSYGTRLLWPFSEQRIAWNLIAVVDPLFTLLLLIGGVIAWRRRRPAAARVTAALALAYLTLGAVQHERATALAQRLAAQRGHLVEAQVVKPTLGNIVLWRSVYRAGGRYYADAIRVGWRVRAFPGGSLPALRVEDFPALAPGSTLHRDLQRFAAFSDGFLVRHPRQPDTVGDVRYAMLPDSVEPLWGIVVDPKRPGRHAPLRHYRSFDSADRQRFLTLLFGGDT